jgi:uncharacterized protein (TIGR02594 family)
MKLALLGGCAALLAMTVPASSVPLPLQRPMNAPLPQAKPRQLVQTAKPPQRVQPARVEQVALSANTMKPTHGMPELVAEARKYMGTNPTDRSRLWCATFMNFILAKLGYAGTNSDAARSFAYYGKRISEPRVGAIAVLTRGKDGGHVGVVSGIDSNGNPVIISGNHNKRVGEAVYARSRVIAYVMPTERGGARTMVASRGPVSLPEGSFESPITELIAAIEAEQARPERPLPQAALQAQARQPAQVQRPAPPPVPHRVVQQSAEAAPQQTRRAPRGPVGDPFSELFNHIENARTQPARGHVAAAETGRGIR